MNIEMLRDKGFELLAKYDAMKVPFSSAKAIFDDLKKRDEVILGQITDGMPFKSEAERLRIAKCSEQYKAFLKELKAANQTYLELDHQKRGIEMMMDFLRSTLAVERELYSRN